MKYDYRCAECVVRQMLFYIKEHEADPERRVKIMNEVLSVMAKHDRDDAPPILAKKVYSLVEDMTGEGDPYREIKRMSNEFALSILPHAKDIIEKSDDKILSALKIAINGNLIDYGARKDVSFDEVLSSLMDSVRTPLDDNTYGKFISDMEKAQSILYICDNAGEIVFDRMFMEYLPHGKITAVVKGGPIINDATVDDAFFVKLSDICTVITTGDATPGIDFPSSSDEFKDAVRMSDMIILKGQGNFETAFHNPLLESNLKSGAPRYFLFKVKCDIVSEEAALPLGTTAFLRV